MTTPTTPGGPSGEQPTYVDPITGSPLYIDPTTGQLSYGPPPTTPIPTSGAAAPTTPIAYPGAATPAASDQASMPGYSGSYPGYPGYPSGYPTTPGYPAGYSYPPQTGTGYTYPLSAYAYGQPRKTNGLAIASLVTGIAGLPFLFCYGVAGILLGLVGAILGHVARRQIKTRGDEGAGMALAGIICGWISVALGIVVLIFFIYIFSHADQFTTN